MSKTLLFLLLLAVGTLSYNNYHACDKPGCKPAAKIDNCREARCYRCGPNEVFNEENLYCDCIPGYVPINGYCGQCREGYSYDPVLQQCIGVNPCGINQHLINGVCRCLPGLIVIQNICQRCPTNQTYFPAFDACRCSVGYTLVNGNCIYIECGLNEVYSVNDQACVCGAGYVKLRNTTDNTTYCGQCPMTQVYDASTLSCIPFVPPECGLHEYFYENCCFCEWFYVRIGGVCVSCPAHSFYDWNTDSCICEPGYYFVGELVMQIPYQELDFGSSFTTNPSYSYSYKGPQDGIPYHTPVGLKGSNYDASGINTNHANINNLYNNPPINGGR